MILDGAMHGTAFLAYLEQVRTDAFARDIVIDNVCPKHRLASA